MTPRHAPHLIMPSSTTFSRRPQMKALIRPVVHQVVQPWSSNRCLVHQVSQPVGVYYLLIFYRCCNLLSRSVPITLCVWIWIVDYWKWIMFVFCWCFFVVVVVVVVFFFFFFFFFFFSLTLVGSHYLSFRWFCFLLTTKIISVFLRIGIFMLWSLRYW